MENSTTAREGMMQQDLPAGRARQRSERREWAGNFVLVLASIVFAIFISSLLALMSARVH